MADKLLQTQRMQRFEVAKPIHIQRLEAALDIRAFVSHVEKTLAGPDASASDDDSDARSAGEMSKGDRIVHGVVTTKQERGGDRRRLLNLSRVSPEREWLRRALLSSCGEESSDDEEGSEDRYIKMMLSQHVMHKKYASGVSARHSRYMYYGAGLLSTVDRYPERSLTAAGKRRSVRTAPQPRRQRRRSEQRTRDNPPSNCGPTDWEEQLNNIKQEQESIDPKSSDYNSKAAIRARKKAAAAKSPEALTARRRRHWQLMAKKELGKVQRARAQQHKEVTQQRRRLATLCCKHWRAKAMQSQKNMKETVWRCKRLSREMLAYWRRLDRAERETRRRMEREAQEQRKMDVEMMEAKRQRRKLNFLITQTELYAHFMQRKLSSESDPQTEHILEQLDDTRLTPNDYYDSEEMKTQACHNAREAFRTDRARMQMFDSAAGSSGSVSGPPGGDYDQPAIFRGTLKGYQLKGMNWLANLYDQGISGILADEMGLGKTVQCIAFLCHVAERLGVWGPFLVVSPASTLHNWQQEMERFVPQFKVVPYWGSPSERRILRQFWERKDLHTPSAAFHVVVTSYQIVVSDLKYLNRVSWQYMILDEAQAIKSSASMRWKLLLGFSCRNRLLLSGTPIQNSMAELWALLHFIMPTLFDSHHEFNEWFSKDIESHAENKTAIDEKHLSRLHMILKPFMLRRIKRDVENELSDKIEVMVHCPLTIRQKLLYSALKKKIKVEDLLHYSGETSSGEKNITSNLMNLVMQFRKVCNHPELFERRDVRSPFAMHCDDYHVPKLLVEEAMLVHSIPSKRHLLYNKFSIHTPDKVQASALAGGAFSWTRLADVSPTEWYRITLCGWLYVMQHIEECNMKFFLVRHRQEWWSVSTQPSSTQLSSGECYERFAAKHALLLCPDGDALGRRREDSPLWSNLLFTQPVWSKGGAFYTHTEHTIHYMPESIEHRGMRMRNTWRDHQSPDMLQEIKTEDGGVTVIKAEPQDLPEFTHVEREPIVRELMPTPIPAFLYCPACKALTPPRKMYASSRTHAYRRTRHEHCETRPGHEMLSRLCEPHGAGCVFLQVPDKNQLVSDAGKLTVLDSLLRRLKERGHRVLIYSQMTKMIDLLEEYMWHRKHKYMRLDGSSKISARRDMVADFQTRADIFVFLLSTRAGGLGINLTAADTVIFYDSDWNPTVDQQAMDRAHRLGQTKQVTVYRLICKGTIEERIMERAREKSEIQRMVISGGNLKPDSLKPKEVVSLLLDDEEIEQKYRLRSEERRQNDENAVDRKRKLLSQPKQELSGDTKRRRDESGAAEVTSQASHPPSPSPAPSATPDDDDSNDALVVDDILDTQHRISLSGVTRETSTRIRQRRGRPRAPRGSGTGKSKPQQAAVTTPLRLHPGGSTVQYDELDITQLCAGAGDGGGGGGGGGSKSRRGPGRPPRRAQPATNKVKSLPSSSYGYN